MKILLSPTTEGFGHASRALAIICRLDRLGLEYGVITDNIRAEFLIKNGVDQSIIDPSLHGISYVYSEGGNEKNLDIPRTMGQLVKDTPKYVEDYLKVRKKMERENYDLLINDINLQLRSIFKKRIINIGHYNSGDSEKTNNKKNDKKTLSYEGVIEPMINAALAGTERFFMDLKKSIIDYKEIFPPIVSDTTKTIEEIRTELGLKSRDRLIVDGRGNPPIDLYQVIIGEHPDLHFFVRAEGIINENIHGKKFVPKLVNYINAADLFITNPGFASLSEGSVYNTPMLIDCPENHMEGLKNLRIAVEEGYGKGIDDLEKDIIEGMQVGPVENGLENGLNYLIEKILGQD